VNPAATLGAYAGALALVFAAAVGIGGRRRPRRHRRREHRRHSTRTPHAPTTPAPHAHDRRRRRPPRSDLAPGGLAVAADGYALELATTTQPAGTPGTLAFTVTGPDGEPLTASRRATRRTSTSSWCGAT
jgi:hypothetical protein